MTWDCPLLPLFPNSISQADLTAPWPSFLGPAPSSRIPRLDRPNARKSPPHGAWALHLGLLAWCWLLLSWLWGVF